MDKQKEKELVAGAEKFLQELIDQRKVSFIEIKQLCQKLQKVLSQNSKNILDNKKDLFNFIKDKNEIKEFLEKEESNYSILTKAAQKISSKNQPQQAKDPDKQTEVKNNQNTIFKTEKKDMIQIFKEGRTDFSENEENLYVYFEDLSKLKLEPKKVPLFTMTYFPNEKAIYFYLNSKEKINLSFDKVDYLCTSSVEIFLDIDYYSMLENNEVEKSREYKGNSLNMELFESIIKNIPLVKKNDLKMIYVGKDYDKYKTEIKNYCLSLKEKVKTVITNNKDFFNELLL